jgi:hypothetical protein
MALTHALVSLVHRRGDRNCESDGMPGVLPPDGVEVLMPKDKHVDLVFVLNGMLHFSCQGVPFIVEPY